MALTFEQYQKFIDDIEKTCNRYGLQVALAFGPKEDLEGKFEPPITIKLFIDEKPEGGIRDDNVNR